MRLFIALDISNRSRELITRKVNILKKHLNQGLKWVKKENWHITMKFLGDCTTQKKGEIIESLEKLDLKEEQKYIQLNEIDAFPNLNEANVLYLDVKRGNNYLKNLNQVLEVEMLKLGFEKNRYEFTPHLTLARNKDNAEVDLNSNFLKRNFINIYSKVDKITLYESKLDKDGPEYFELFTKKLK